MEYSQDDTVHSSELSESTDSNYSNTLKLILLGDTGVGKSSLIRVSVGNQFSNIVPSTVASSFVPKKFYKGNRQYILNIWDTAGQEKFRAMTKLFVKNTKIVIFVYAINNKSSFESLKFWVSIVKEALGDEPILALVGNKSDLYVNEQISEKIGSNYAKEIGAKFTLASAKCNAKGFMSTKILSSIISSLIVDNCV
jgi:small GTP-binding protein